MSEYENTIESEHNELVSELYSILYTINAVEKNFIKGLFKTDTEKAMYQNSVDEMLVQWVSVSDALNIDDNFDIDINAKKIFPWCVGNEFESLKFGIRRVKCGVNGFKEKYIEDGNAKGKFSEIESKIDNVIGKESNEKVIEVNKSNTNMELDTSVDNFRQSKKAIAEATSAFITLMDAIKLNYDSKYTLHPLFSDVLTKSGKVSTEFTNRNKLVSWLIKLNQMDIADTLNEAELKEILWDVDSAYNGFFDQL